MAYEPADPCRIAVTALPRRFVLRDIVKLMCRSDTASGSVSTFAVVTDGRVRVAEGRRDTITSVMVSGGQYIK